MSTASETTARAHHTPDHKEEKPDPCCEAIDKIAAGVKKLTDAGVGGAEAGRLAFDVWACCHGHGKK